MPGRISYRPPCAQVVFAVRRKAKLWLVLPTFLGTIFQTSHCVQNTHIVSSTGTLVRPRLKPARNNSTHTYIIRGTTNTEETEEQFKILRSAGSDVNKNTMLKGCRLGGDTEQGAYDICEQDGDVHRLFGSGGCRRPDLHDMLSQIATNPDIEKSSLVFKYEPITPFWRGEWVKAFTSRPLPPQGQGDWTVLHERGVHLLKNFLSPKEADDIAQMTQSQSPMRSGVNYRGGSICGFRLSKAYNLHAIPSVLPPDLKGRMSIAVGLHKISEEGTALTGYSKGDFYSPHTDEFMCDHHHDGTEVPGITSVKASMTLPPMVCERKRRFGTLLVYLTDAIDGGGGATHFPVLNLRVWPEKGSAIFFRPTAPNGEADPAMLHAAEMVTKGSKVVMQQWFDG